MKTLVVGDLHLWDREMSTSRKMIQSSTDALLGIKQAILDDPEIKMVFFLGDIQHVTPKSVRTLRETTIWKSILGEIGAIISERCPKFLVVPREINEEQDGYFKALPQNPQPLFSLRGNHDIVKGVRKLDTTYNYTFFDDILHTGMVQNPRGVIFKDSGKMYYFQLNNYGEVDFPIPPNVQELDDNLTKIKLLHDTIKTESSPDWFSMLGEEDYYLSEDVLGDSDFAICGHIHEPLAPTEVLGNGRLGRSNTVFMQTGAVGRTSFTDGNMRDFGYCTVIDTTDGVHLSELRIPLCSVEEFFDWKQINLNNNKKEAIKAGKMFSLDFGSKRVISKDPTEEISLLSDVSDIVKSNCIEAIRTVESDN